MSRSLVKYQFTRYLLGLMIFDFIIFTLNEIIPFGIYFLRGNLKSFSFMNHIGSVITYLSVFTFFYIISTYGGYFKLGMQNSMPRNQIWRSQLTSNLLVALFQTVFTMLVNFTIIMPFQRISNVTNMYQNIYSNYFHNRILSIIFEFVINYLSLLFVVGLAMALATFISLLIKRLRKWFWTFLVIIFVLMLIMFGYILANYDSSNTIFRELFRMISFAFGLVLKVNAHHDVTIQRFEPINLIITMAILDFVLISISRWFNNHIQIKKLL